MAGGAIGLAIILGALSSLLPLEIVLIAVAGIAVVSLSVARPFIGLFAIFVLVFEILPPEYQPGMGKLRAYDVMVVFLTAVVILWTIARGQSVLKALGSMIWPLLYLTVCLTVSFVYVRYFSPNEAALSEGRSQFLWLILPLIALGIDSRVRFKYFVIGAMTLGAIVALYSSLESLFNVKILSQKSAAPLDVFGNSDIVRSFSGGGAYIMIFAMFLSINLLVERRMKILLGFPLLALLSLGLAVQFGRGLWVAAAGGLLLSAAIHRGWGGVLRIVAVSSVAVGLLLGGMAIVKPRVAQALIERVTGIGEEVESGGSFGFRKMENRYALAAIEKSPIFGVGIGGIYKPTATAAAFGFSNEATYIHNAWLWYPLKFGLWASLIPVVFILCFYREVYKGLRSHHAGQDRGAWFIAAVAGAFLVPVITSYTQPEWSSPQGIAALAILMGCALLYGRLGSPFPLTQKRR